MRRVVEFDLVTKSEPNTRFASQAGMFAKAARTKEQRAAVRDVLRAHLGTPPPLHVVQVGDRHEPVGAVGMVVRNTIAVTLTRIAPGLLDSFENLPAALKAVVDEIAAWIGPKDNDSIYTWKAAQEKAAAGVYRVRIEILDKLTGEERVVKLAETRSAAVEAERRVKKAISAQVKARGVYHAEDAAKGASSAARVKADALFAKVTGKPSPTVLQHPTYGAVSVDAGGIVLRASSSKRRTDRDPGEEQPAWKLAPCTSCGAPLYRPCYPKAGLRTVFGVHVARARAAGLYVPEDDRGAVKPARAPRGARKLAPVAQPQLPLQRAFVALPWEQPACDMCGGRGTSLVDREDPRCVCKGTGTKLSRLAPAPRYDGLDEPPTTITAGVPSEHVARYGKTITLTREPFTSPKTGHCWLYTTTKETTT